LVVSLHKYKRTIVEREAGRDTRRRAACTDGLMETAVKDPSSRKLGESATAADTSFPDTELTTNLVSFTYTTKI
jgi:hypothetical protein